MLSRTSALVGLVLAIALALACFPGPRADAQGGGAAQRRELQAKVDRVRSAVQAMKSRGEDPKPVFLLMKDVGPLIEKGRIDEATSRVDAALALVGETSAAPSAAAPIAETPSPLPPGRDAGNGWRHASDLPVLDVLRSPTGLPAAMQKAPLRNWNDPSVLKEGDRYVMWASVGMQGGGKDVAIYKLTSANGTEWSVANGGQPVLEGDRGKWDAYGVETPAVLRVGDTYHMYYTAYQKPGGHIFTMGHATSPDGEHWTKRGELTSLTSRVGKNDGNPWGWLARAEPTAVYHDGEFWLYFTDVRCRVDCKGGKAPAIRGISLAKSRDGHHFTQVGSEPVLLQSASYPESEGWEGYSTPWVLHDGTSFHLFADVFRKGEKHYQTRIAHYQSEDGVQFREVEPDVVRVEGHPWATKSVRAPSVLLDGGRWMMWYAGDNFDQENKPKDILAAIRAGQLRMGIALMVR